MSLVLFKNVFSVFKVSLVLFKNVFSVFKVSLVLFKNVFSVFKVYLMFFSVSHSCVWMLAGPCRCHLCPCQWRCTWSWQCGGPAPLAARCGPWCGSSAEPACPASGLLPPDTHRDTHRDTQRHTQTHHTPVVTGCVSLLRPPGGAVIRRKARQQQLD